MPEINRHAYYLAKIVVFVFAVRVLLNTVFVVYGIGYATLIPHAMFLALALSGIGNIIFVGIIYFSFPERVRGLRSIGVFLCAMIAFTWLNAILHIIPDLAVSGNITGIERELVSGVFIKVLFHSTPSALLCLALINWNDTLIVKRETLDLRTRFSKTLSAQR